MPVLAQARVKHAAICAHDAEHNSGRARDARRGSAEIGRRRKSRNKTGRIALKSLKIAKWPISRPNDFKGFREAKRNEKFRKRDFPFRSRKTRRRLQRTLRVSASLTLVSGCVPAVTVRAAEAEKTRCLLAHGRERASSRFRANDRANRPVPPERGAPMATRPRAIARAGLAPPPRRAARRRPAPPRLSPRKSRNRRRAAPCRETRSGRRRGAHGPRSGCGTNRRARRGRRARRRAR